MAYNETDRPAVGTRVRVLGDNNDYSHRFKPGDICEICSQDDSSAPKVRRERDGEKWFVHMTDMEPVNAVPAAAPSAPSAPSTASPALRLIAETLLKLTVREMETYIDALNAAPNTIDDYITPKCLLTAADHMLKAA